MTIEREEFLSQASPEMMDALREKVSSEGRYFQEVLGDAVSAYVASEREVSRWQRLWV